MRAAAREQFSRAPRRAFYALTIWRCAQFLKPRKNGNTEIEVPKHTIYLGLGLGVFCLWVSAAMRLRARAGQVPARSATRFRPQAGVYQGRRDRDGHRVRQRTSRCRQLGACWTRSRRGCCRVAVCSISVSVCREAQLCLACRRLRDGATAHVSACRLLLLRVAAELNHPTPLPRRLRLRKRHSRHWWGNGRLPSAWPRAPRQTDMRSSPKLAAKLPSSTKPRLSTRRNATFALGLGVRRNTIVRCLQALPRWGDSARERLPAALSHIWLLN